MSQSDKAKFDDITLEEFMEYIDTNTLPVATKPKILQRHIDSVSALIFNKTKDEILLVCEKTKLSDLAYHPSLPKTYWTLPGGKKTEQQSEREALDEEILQETGMKLIEVIVPVCQVIKDVPHEHFSRTRTLFRCTVQNGVPRANDPDDNVLEAKWVKLAEAKELLEKIPDASDREPFLLALFHDNIAQDWIYSKDRNGVTTCMYPAEDDKVKTVYNHPNILQGEELKIA